MQEPRLGASASATSLATPPADEQPTSGGPHVHSTAVPASPSWFGQAVLAAIQGLFAPAHSPSTPAHSGRIVVDARQGRRAPSRLALSPVPTATPRPPYRFPVLLATPTPHIPFTSTTADLLGYSSLIPPLVVSPSLPMPAAAPGPASPAPRPRSPLPTTAVITATASPVAALVVITETTEAITLATSLGTSQSSYDASIRPLDPAQEAPRTSTAHGDLLALPASHVWIEDVRISAWPALVVSRTAAVLHAVCRGNAAGTAHTLAVDLSDLAAVQAQGDQLNATVQEAYRSANGAFLTGVQIVAVRNFNRQTRYAGYVARYQRYLTLYHAWEVREKAYWQWSAAHYAFLVAVAQWHARSAAYDRYATLLAAYRRALPGYYAAVQAGQKAHIPPPPVAPAWPGPPPHFTRRAPVRLPRPRPVPIPPAPPYLDPAPQAPQAPPEWQSVGSAALPGMGSLGHGAPFAADYVAASVATGVPIAVLMAQDAVESSFRPWVSNGQYQGLGQMGAAERRKYGVIDGHDPLQSIVGQARYDAVLYQDLGSWPAVFAAYNEGESAYRARGASGVESYHNGTTYMDRIAAALADLVRKGWLGA